MMKVARKLGIKPGMKVLIRDAPSDFTSLEFVRWDQAVKRPQTTEWTV
jgi:hypothetical protein